MSNKSKSRAEYGFQLSFPKTPFTISYWRQFRKFASIPNITFYKRIRNALADGTLVEVGRQNGEGRGRPKTLYSRADVAASVVVPAKAKV